MTEPQPSTRQWTVSGRSLLGGSAQGRAIVLAEPLSLWGGLDPQTGTIIDTRHPQFGRSLAGRVLVMPSGRGSSSSSSVLAETLRAHTGPAAVVLRDADEIILVGCLVIQLLDRVTVPVVQVDDYSYRRFEDGAEVTIALDGTLTVRPRLDTAGAITTQRNAPASIGRK